MGVVTILIREIVDGNDRPEKEVYFECETTEQLFRRLVHNYGKCEGIYYHPYNGLACGWRFHHRRFENKVTKTFARIKGHKTVSRCKVPWFIEYPKQRRSK